MIQVKEEFLGSVKTQLAVEIGGWEALGLWLALKGYVAMSNSGGFIPTESIPKLPGVPRNWQKAMRGLVECGKLQPDGSRTGGLVERVEHGVILHHYEDHGTPVEVEGLRRQKAREQKARRRAELARELAEKLAAEAAANQRGSRPDRTGQQNRTEPDKSGGHDRTEQPDFSADSPADGPRAGAGAGTLAHGLTRAPSPAQPSSAGASSSQQDPDQPDRSGSARDLESLPMPFDLASALALPPKARALACQRDPSTVGLFCRPAEWPEIKDFAKAVGAALGWRVALGSYPRDSGLVGAVELLASGYSTDDLVRAAWTAQKNTWFSEDKSRRVLSSFTPKVVARLLAGADPSTPAPVAGDPRPPLWKPEPLPPRVPPPPRSAPRLRASAPVAEQRDVGDPETAPPGDQAREGQG